MTEQEYTPTEADALYELRWAATSRANRMSPEGFKAAIERVRADERAKRPDREQLRQALNNEGAFCGNCGREPGDPIAHCDDCNQVLSRYADAVLSLERADDALRSTSDDEPNPDMPVSFGPLEHCIRHIGGTHGDYVGEVMHRPRTEWTSCDCEDRDS